MTRQLACALAVSISLAALVEARQKPPKTLIHPTTADFVSGAIRDDGRGPLFDGQDGVTSYRVEGSGSTNGWAWDVAGNRSAMPRSLIYDLTQPHSGPSQGVIQITNTRGQIYDLSDMQVGEVKYVRASFHLIINRVDYVLRFGQTPGDGSSALEVTRLSESAFQVRTSAQGDLARFLKGNGPGSILLGIYHVPLELTLTNQ